MLDTSQYLAGIDEVENRQSHDSFHVVVLLSSLHANA